MAIVVIFMSLLGGIAGVGIALCCGMGWIVTFGAYLLGGMIGSMFSIVVAIARSELTDPQHNIATQSAA